MNPRPARRPIRAFAALTALGLPLGLAGLATGAAPAQAQEFVRTPADCGPSDISDFGPDIQCFRDTATDAAERRRALLAAMTCTRGNEAVCAGAAGPLVTDVYETIQFVVLNLAGDELDRRANTFAISQLQTTSRTETVTTQAIALRDDTFETRVTGQISGGAIVYDQTFAAPVADPAVVAGFSDATLAVTSSGGPGVVVLAPILVERSETLLDTQTDTVRTVVGTPVETFTFALRVGGNGISLPFGRLVGAPGSNTGEFGLCDTADRGDGLPGGCGFEETVIVVPFGADVLNFNTNTHIDILETVTTTETWRIFEHWQVQGTVQAVGTVNAAIRSGGYDMNARFLRRLMAQDAGQPATLGGVPLAYAPESERTPASGAIDSLVTTALDEPAAQRFAYRGWLEGYATTASASAQGAVPGDRRTGWGLSGGGAYSFANGLTLGFGVDRGWTDVSLAAVGESGDIELTQFGLSARFDAGRWFAGGAVTYGIGDVDTTQTLGGASTAAYDLEVFGLVAETGYRFDIGRFALTPSVGFDYTHLTTGAFAGAGAVALAAPAFSSDRTRAFAGLNVATGIDTGGGRLELSGNARVVGVLSGEERLLPVVLAGAPGAPLTVTGASEGRIGLDLGAQAAFRFDGGAEIFARYDGQFRDGFDAHQGTVGIRISW